MRKSPHVLWTLAALAVLAAPLTLDSVLKSTPSIHRSLASVEPDTIEEGQEANSADEAARADLEYQEAARESARQTAELELQAQAEAGQIVEILDPIEPMAALQPLLPLNLDLVVVDPKPEVSHHARRNRHQNRRPSVVSDEDSRVCKGAEQVVAVTPAVTSLESSQTQILQMLLSMVQMQTQMLQTMQTMMTATNGFNYFSMPQNNGLIGQPSPLSMLPGQYSFNPFMQQQSSPFQQQQAQPSVINNYYQGMEGAQLGAPQQPQSLPGAFNFGGVDDSSRSVFGNFGPLIGMN